MNLSIKAQNHTKEMEKEYSFEIAKSIHESEIFRDTPNFRKKIPAAKNDTSFSIEDKLIDNDSVSTIFLPEVQEQLKSGKKVAVLNFASFKNPGGKFLDGSSTQEEALCHCSYLYNVLKAFQNNYYIPNRRDTFHCLYNNSAIYSAGIRFWNINLGEEITEQTPSAIVDVITCSAPNATAAYKYYNEITPTIVKNLEERIIFIKQICEIKQVDVLIAGAFGCGVFGNNAHNVATLFHRHFQNSPIPNPSIVIHPVPNTHFSKNSHNFYNFRLVFSKDIINNQTGETIEWH